MYKPCRHYCCSRFLQLINILVDFSTLQSSREYNFLIKWLVIIWNRLTDNLSIFSRSSTVFLFLLIISVCTSFYHNYFLSLYYIIISKKAENRYTCAFEWRCLHFVILPFYFQTPKQTLDMSFVGTFLHQLKQTNHSFPFNPPESPSRSSNHCLRRADFSNFAVRQKAALTDKELTNS